MLNQVDAEKQNLNFVVTDAKSSREKKAIDDIQIRYLRAKWDHYIDSKLAQLELTTDHFEEMSPVIEIEDEIMKNKMEYMYSYIDFRSDRHRARERFVKHVNKKSTIEDIGGLLDRFVLDSKANTEFFQPEHHILEKPKYATKDVTEADLFWQAGYLATAEPIKPNWLDDNTDYDKQPTLMANIRKETVEQVMFQDAHRDHSIDSLTAEDKQEIILFHSFK